MLKPLRVLVACEFTGRVRDSFRQLGHDAYSCDLINTSTEDKTYHILGDVRDILDSYQGKKWNLMIAHPPCTHLAISGARWFKEHKKEQKQQEALEFILTLLNAPIPRICVENPISVISSMIKKPSQIVHPWWFGEPDCKSTCLWLKRLPKLEKTNVVPLKERNVKAIHWMNKDKHRSMIRSKTYWSIARAMATQWGSIEVKEWEHDLPPCSYVIKK